MNKGDQVLLGVGPNDGAELVQGWVMVQACDRDPHDLALADLQLNSTSLTLPEPVTISATLTDSVGQLVDPAYYDLVFYANRAASP